MLNRTYDCIAMLIKDHNQEEVIAVIDAIYKEANSLITPERYLSLLFLALSDEYYSVTMHKDYSVVTNLFNKLKNEKIILNISADKLSLLHPLAKLGNHFSMMEELLTILRSSPENALLLHLKAQDKNGNTPLHLAAKHRSKKSFKKLLREIQQQEDAAEIINQTNSRGNTPLVELLLQLKNSIDKNPNYKNNKFLLERLIKAPSNLTIKNKQGICALQLIEQLQKQYPETTLWIQQTFLGAQSEKRDDKKNDKETTTKKTSYEEKVETLESYKNLFLHHSNSLYLKNIYLTCAGLISLLHKIAAQLEVNAIKEANEFNPSDQRIMRNVYTLVNRKSETKNSDGLYPVTIEDRVLTEYTLLSMLPLYLELIESKLKKQAEISEDTLKNLSNLREKLPKSSTSLRVILEKQNILHYLDTCIKTAGSILNELNTKRSYSLLARIASYLPGPAFLAMLVGFEAELFTLKNENVCNRENHDYSNCQQEKLQYNLIIAISSFFAGTFGLLVSVALPVYVAGKEVKVSGIKPDDKISTLRKALNNVADHHTKVKSLLEDLEQLSIQLQTKQTISSMRANFALLESTLIALKTTITNIDWSNEFLPDTAQTISASPFSISDHNIGTSNDYPCAASEENDHHIIIINDDVEDQHFDPRNYVENEKGKEKQESESEDDSDALDRKGKRVVGIRLFEIRRGYQLDLEADQDMEMQPLILDKETLAP